MVALTLVGFLFHGALHLEPATIALAGAIVLMIVAREEPHEVLREIEWPTLFFFIGLFMLVSGVIEIGAIDAVSRELASLTGGSLGVASMFVLWLSAVVSGIVDNIPYTATMLPVIHDLSAPHGTRRAVVVAGRRRRPGRQRHDHRRLGQRHPGQHGRPRGSPDQLPDLRPLRGAGDLRAASSCRAATSGSVTSSSPMEHTREILAQLFVMLLAAKVGDELFKRLRQPPIVGEILGGVLVGPAVLGWYAINPETTLFAEIGVVLLLFQVGVETRLADLLRVGGTAASVGLSGWRCPSRPVSGSAC